MALPRADGDGVGTVRVVVIVVGQSADHEIVSATMRGAEAREQLRLISAAQRRGSDALLALPWLTVAEKHIRAVYIREVPAGAPGPAERRS